MKRGWNFFIKINDFPGIYLDIPSVSRIIENIVISVCCPLFLEGEVEI